MFKAHHIIVGIYGQHLKRDEYWAGDCWEDVDRRHHRTRVDRTRRDFPICNGISDFGVLFSASLCCARDMNVDVV